MFSFALRYLFLQDIAEAYDLHYIPDSNLDNHYINYYGFDNRKLNDQLPFRMKSFDIHEFLQDPWDVRAVTMHLLMYGMRLKNYVDALAHVLNTGRHCFKLCSLAYRKPTLL